MRFSLRGRIKGSDQQSSKSDAEVICRRLGSVVVARVNVESGATRLGLTLETREVHKGIFVRHIDSASPFAKTPLRKGMVIFRINSDNVEGSSLGEVEALLRSSKGGIRVWAEDFKTITTKEKKRQSWARHNGAKQHLRHHIDETIGKQTIVIAAKKKRLGEKLGFTLNRTDDGEFTVGFIHPTSPLRHSALREGMTVKSVNGLLLSGRRLDVALSALRDTEGTVIIGAEADLESDFSLPNMLRKRIMTTTFKEKSNDSLGISLIHVPMSTTNGLVVINRVSRHCLFRDLEVGMEIKTINGVDVSKGDVRGAMRLLHDSPHKIEIVCEVDMLLDDISSSSTISSTVGNSTAGSVRSQRSTLSRSLRSNESIERPSVLGSFAVTAVKHAADELLGVLLDESSTGYFKVSFIADDSPFKNTNLHVGSQVISVNGVILAGLKIGFVSVLLKQIVGTVELQCLPSPDCDNFSEDHERIGWC